MARKYFNPRSPHGERRHEPRLLFSFFDISIHAPRTGSDSHLQDTKGVSRYFNPRSPHGERPDATPSLTVPWNFNPRSPHGERPPNIQTRAVSVISIHAPRTGSDSRIANGERNVTPFQSTLPARGATARNHATCEAGEISIHAPRTGSDELIEKMVEEYKISIHAPRTGSDGSLTIQTARPDAISIHAPRTGSDLPLITLYIHSAYFNPRSPHGERPMADAKALMDAVFQSTLPARGATGFHAEEGGNDNISIHAPRTGSDTRWHPAYQTSIISIHAPRTGSDHARCVRKGETQYFNPRSPHGERPAAATRRNHFRRYFNPRSPHGERLHRAGIANADVRISIHAPRTGSDGTKK